VGYGYNSAHVMAQRIDLNPTAQFLKKAQEHQKKANFTTVPQNI